MGMYSTYMWDEIEVKDYEALKKVKKEHPETEDSWWWDLINPETGEIEFENWSGGKIEGYWYDGTIEVLSAIAPYVDGYVQFEYEEGYQFRICFIDGKVIVKIGEVDWDRIEGYEALE